MNGCDFCSSIGFAKSHLINKEVARIYNSIGSHLFIKFGKDIESILPNGKKYLHKEWCIWVGNASWRITKDNEYYIGSGASLSVNIQSHVEKLLNKRLQSIQFTSQFFDMEVNFEDGYQLTTFFNWAKDNQWTLFLPNLATITIDCSNKDEIQNVQALNKHLSIVDAYKTTDILKNDVAVLKITYDKNDMPMLHCENNILISLNICAWRLEKDNDYCVGYLDGDKSKIQAELSELIGKKLRQIDIANPMMDARFQFNNQYVLKTFTCCRAAKQWGISSKKTVLFSANISISDS